jgi:hypothetical protein
MSDFLQLALVVSVLISATKLAGLLSSVRAGVSRRRSLARLLAAQAVLGPPPGAWLYGLVYDGLLLLALLRRFPW